VGGGGKTLGGFPKQGPSRKNDSEGLADWGKKQSRERAFAGDPEGDEYQYRIGEDISRKDCT